MDEAERRAPVQGDRDSKNQKRPSGTIAWSEHEEAWAGYQRFYPRSASQQNARKIAKRGGFGRGELLMFLGHEPTTFALGGGDHAE